MATKNLDYQNFYQTTLLSPMNATDTVAYLNILPVPAESFLVIDPDVPASREIVWYTSKGANFINIPSVATGRGVGGTTAVSHLAGATVKLMNVAELWRELQNGNALTGMHTYLNAAFFPYVSAGLVWTADSPGTTKNASMTAGTVYINGRKTTVTSVTARVFTASKDTYVDVLDNGDGTGTLVYTEVTNNAASPALAGNSIRIAIIVTGATSIAGAGSINQGDPTSVLPIASSVAYSVTDSLGNLICNRNPNPTQIGYRQIIASANTGGVNTIVDIAGLSVPVIVPAGRRIKVKFYARGWQCSGAPAGLAALAFIREGSTTLNYWSFTFFNGAVDQGGIAVEVVLTPSAGLHTYLASHQSPNAAFTITTGAGPAQPAFVSVELV